MKEASSPIMVSLVSGGTSELIYLRARYYSPWDGRFLSKDVWDGDPNQPMSYNPWLYAYANPVNLTDPTRMYPCSICSRISPVAYEMCMRCCDDSPAPANPFLITFADVQKSSNGTLLSYLEDEADRDPALTLARVAMGESGNLEERYRIMWVTINRSALGFKDNKERGWDDSPVDRFYPIPTGIRREVLEPGKFQYSPIEVAVYMNITNPETEATGNLKAMLYPSGDLEDAFRSTGLEYHPLMEPTTFRM